jgi:hypothetical protein
MQDIHYTSTIQTSSLLYKWAIQSIPTHDYILEIVDRVGDSVALANLSKGDPRLLWTLPELDPSGEDLLLEIKTSSDTDYTYIRNAKSLFDFFYTRDPVYITNGIETYLRNIAHITISASSSTYTYSVTANDIQPDEPIWVQYETNKWEKIPGGSEFIDTIAGTITSTETTGSTLLYYPSITRIFELEEPCIYQNKNNIHTPVRYNLWNLIDERALEVDISRLTDETNSELLDRIKTVYIKPPSTIKDGLLVSIARDLGLMGSFYWNGVDTINLSSSGITEIFIPEVPEVVYISNEQLTPNINNTAWHSKTHDWEPSWNIYVNSLLIDPEEDIYPSIITNRIVFPSGTDTSNFRRVVADYSYTNYTITTTGTSTILAPTSNLASGEYRILYIKDVSLSHLDPEEVGLNDVDIVDTYRLPEYKEIIRNLKDTLPILIGEASWSSITYWFKNDETTPRLTTIPIAFS